MRIHVTVILAALWPCLALAQSAPEAAPVTASEQPAAMPAQEDWAIHGQSTATEQYHPAFTAPYSGPQSLNRGSRGDETFDATLYAGVRPWQGAEIWANPEIDQGFGLSNTFGVAGFPSAESYKLGARDPYILMQRLFLRQTIALGGDQMVLTPQANQLGGSTTTNRIVLTVGKFSLTDMFDANKYAHDPRNDFLNWSVVDGGWFDYAGDAWGYTYGGAAEWYQDRWTLRAAIADTPTTPGYKYLDPAYFHQFQIVAEIEERHTLWEQPGVVRLTGFLTREKLGNFNQAVALTQTTGTTVQASDILRYASRGGIGINLEQQIVPDVGVFLRAGTSTGNNQITSFTDINQSVSFGVSVAGTRWGRPDDTVGSAVVWNQISRQFKAYLNSGGLGILIGDGQLSQSGPEQISETYYSFAATKWANVTADYQFINNPGYNRQRGPVSVLGGRLHVSF